MATKAEIFAVQDNINRILKSRGSDKEIYVSWAYGRPRATLFYTSSGQQAEDDMSPRLPKPQMLDWLYAFERGLTFE
ncbi:MAG: hypothetical protein ACXACR_14650 [Candidatus Hodarchaeales archaeon]|jgi:hypothetical protein